MNEPLETFPDLAAVDAAQGRVSERTGQRLYTVDAKFRAHVESERTRLMSGQPAPEPVQESFAGVSGVDPLGRRTFIDGNAPDDRMLALCAQLQARRGPDGRRLVETDPDYRADVEASLAEAIAGAKWSRDAELLAQRLADEAKAQAKDAGLYRGAERQPDFVFDRTDPMFQDAARTADAAGLSDEQFRAMLDVWLRQTGVSR